MEKPRRFSLKKEWFREQGNRRNLLLDRTGWKEPRGLE